MSSIPQTSGIYKIVCIPTGKIYIGSAVNLRRRWRTHSSDLRTGRHWNKHLQYAWNKYGEDAFEFMVIELVLISFLLEREQYWLDKLHVCDRSKGFNLSPTAGSILGYKRPNKRPPPSPETILKLKKAMEGVKRSEETQRKMTMALRGRKLSADHCRKIGDIHRGKVITEEAIEKHKKTYRANQSNHNISKRWWVVTSPTGEEYTIKGLGAFCREHGLCASNLRQVALGKRRHSTGWECRHADAPCEDRQ